VRRECLLRADDDLAGTRQMLPPRAHTLKRAHRRLDDDQIHELAVDKLLKGQCPQGLQRFAVEAELPTEGAR